MTVTQPAPKPLTPEQAYRLAATGKLINLAGEPLRLAPCKACNHHETLGETCPSTVACPTCGAAAGRQRCRRPSGHDAWDVLPWCAERRQAAELVDVERQAVGDPTVPAPWPVEQDALF